jgi:hypothetical protein
MSSTRRLESPSRRSPAILGRTNRGFEPRTKWGVSLQPAKGRATGPGGARRGCSPLLRVEQSRGRGQAGGESRTSDCTHQRPSWGGEVAGARGSGLEGSRKCSRMAWAVEERRTTATTRRVPPQRGQARTSVWNVRLRSSAQGMGWRGRTGSGARGQEASVRGPLSCRHQRVHSSLTLPPLRLPQILELSGNRWRR